MSEAVGVITRIAVHFVFNMKAARTFMQAYTVHRYDTTSDHIRFHILRTIIIIIIASVTLALFDITNM